MSTPVKLARVLEPTNLEPTNNSSRSETRLLDVQPLDELLKPCGPIEVAIDTIGATTGDLVLLETTNSSQLHIIGITSSVDVMAREETPNKNSSV